MVYAYIRPCPDRPRDYEIRRVRQWGDRLQLVAIVHRMREQLITQDAFDALCWHLDDADGDPHEPPLDWPGILLREEPSVVGLQIYSELQAMPGTYMCRLIRGDEVLHWWRTYRCMRGFAIESRGWPDIIDWLDSLNGIDPVAARWARLYP